MADKWTKHAQRLGFPARSVFKLQELDTRFKIFPGKQLVLDIGCSPGSWLMYGSQQLPRTSKLIGIDRNAVTARVLDKCGPASVKSMVVDVLKWKVSDGLHNKFDLVMSDLAPQTIGEKTYDMENCFQLSETAFQIALKTLKKDGDFVVKIFQGGVGNARFRDFRARAQEVFETVYIFTPAATRAHSAEVYLVGKGFKRQLPKLS